MTAVFMMMHIGMQGLSKRERKHMNAVYISVENVNYSYEKTHPILKNITFTAKEHGCIELIGANGA